MSVVKSKSSSKLKAGKKKSVNKWIIVAGVATIAVIGAVIVRFSSAGSWPSAYRAEGKFTVTKDSTMFNYEGLDLVKGRTYRFCARGYSNSGTSTASIYLGHNVGEYVSSASSIKQYGPKSELHCSGTIKAGSHDVGYIMMTKTAGANITITAVSIDWLR